MPSSRPTLSDTVSLSKWHTLDPYTGNPSATSDSRHLSPSVFTDENYNSILTDRSQNTKPVTVGTTSQASMIDMLKAGGSWARKKLGAKVENFAKNGGRSPGS